MAAEKAILWPFWPPSASHARSTGPLPSSSAYCLPRPPVQPDLAASPCQREHNSSFDTLYSYGYISSISTKKYVFEWWYCVSLQTLHRKFYTENISYDIFLLWHYELRVRVHVGALWSRKNAKLSISTINWSVTSSVNSLLFSLTLKRFASKSERLLRFLGANGLKQLELLSVARRQRDLFALAGVQESILK